MRGSFALHPIRRRERRWSRGWRLAQLRPENERLWPTGGCLLKDTCGPLWGRCLNAGSPLFHHGGVARRSRHRRQAPAAQFPGYGSYRFSAARSRRSPPLKPLTTLTLPARLRAPRDRRAGVSPGGDRITTGPHRRTAPGSPTAHVAASHGCPGRDFFSPPWGARPCGRSSRRSKRTPRAALISSPARRQAARERVYHFASRGTRAPSCRGLGTRLQRRPLEDYEASSARRGIKYFSRTRTQFTCATRTPVDDERPATSATRSASVRRPAQMALMRDYPSLLEHSWIARIGPSIHACDAEVDAILFFGLFCDHRIPAPALRDRRTGLVLCNW